MSNTITVRVQPDVKIQAQRIAKELGFSLSSLINAFLRQFVREKTVRFGLYEEPTEYTLKAIEKSKKDFSKGEVYKFSDGKKAVEFINELIKE